jgi:2-oxoglutarate dehydrogenase E2 component (dihydrolipoamide succinyltransferase)
MKVEIKVPAVGESVKEAVLAQWFRRNGDLVRKDEILFLIETDKVTLEIVAETDGILHILEPPGTTVPIGAVIGFIDAEVKAETVHESGKAPESMGSAPGVLSASASPVKEAVEPELAYVPATPSPAAKTPAEILPPSVRRLVAEKGLNVAQLQGTGPGGRITKGDVLFHLEQKPVTVAPPDTEKPSAPPPPFAREQPALVAVPPSRAARAESTIPAATPSELPSGAEERISRQPMSRIRLRIAERLLEARQHTAMLTTFNEVDMSAVKTMRARFKESFRQKYGVSLGLTSFFIKATIAALQEFPEANASIDGKHIVYHHYYHIGIAVGADRGLVVPVIRHADRLSFAQLEHSIVDFVQKIKDNRLELADLEGGTFTITNGGVYGSLLSTPILNTPQSGILGLHKIEDRPVAVAGQVVIRSMMYVALSYDHRLIDGRQAVTFLKRIKECIENPERILLEV